MIGRQINLLIVDSADDARTVREMLESIDGMRVSFQCAETLVSALNVLSRHTFDAALVELSLPDSEGLATFETIRRHARGVPIVIHTGVANEGLALTSVERGAQDYLLKKKLTSMALVRVLQYAIARHRSAAEDGGKTEVTEATVCSFAGAKGGVGATTVASHFALELRGQTGEKTLLMDLDCSSRSSSFLMKIESRYSLLDAATNLHRLDSTFWSGLVSSAEGGLDVLQAPGNAGFGDRLDGERVRHVLRFARTLYRYIVMDLGRLGPAALTLLEETNDLYVVTTGTLPEMYEATRVLKKIRDLGFNSGQIRLVFNKVSKSALLSSSELKKSMGEAAYWTLPDYSREMEDAYASGNFLGRSLPMRKQISQLVAKSLGVQPKPSGRSVLGLLKLARA